MGFVMKNYPGNSCDLMDVRTNIAICGICVRLSFNLRALRRRVVPGSLQA
jgi:hypothetical protein